MDRLSLGAVYDNFSELKYSVAKNNSIRLIIPSALLLLRSKLFGASGYIYSSLYKYSTKAWYCCTHAVLFAGNNSSFVTYPRRDCTPKYLPGGRP